MCFVGAGVGVGVVVGADGDVEGSCSCMPFSNGLGFVVKYPKPRWRKLFNQDKHKGRLLGGLGVKSEWVW